MSKLTLTGMRMTGIRRLKSSVNGNPRYDVAFVDGDGQPHVYTTHSDASVSYEVTDYMTYTDRDSGLRLTVTLIGAQRITGIAREG